MDTKDAYSGSRRTRRRTVSLSSVTSVQSRITLNFPKAELAAVTVHTRLHTVYGSFIPTPPVRPSLYHLKCSLAPSKSFLSIASPPHLQITSSHSWVDEEGDSPLTSGSTSPSIPSFSRTALPPPLQPSVQTPSTDHPIPFHQTHTQNRSGGLDPILAKLERKSKLLTKKAFCATCKKAGSDFPKCGRCNAMWCSRECRMVGGKRHVCSFNY